MYTYRFYYFKFRVSPSQTALTPSLMTTDLLFTRPQSTGLSGLGQCWSLVTSFNWSHERFRVYRCTPVDLVCLTRESQWKCYERPPQAGDCRRVCQSMLDILNTAWHCDSSYKQLYWVKFHFMRFVFKRKLREFCNKQNLIARIWEFLLVKVIWFTRIIIQINGPKLIYR